MALDPGPGGLGLGWNPPDHCIPPGGKRPQATTLDRGSLPLPDPFRKYIHHVPRGLHLPVLPSIVSSSHPFPRQRHTPGRIPGHPRADVLPRAFLGARLTHRPHGQSTLTPAGVPQTPPRPRRSSNSRLPPRSRSPLPHCGPPGLVLGYSGCALRDPTDSLLPRGHATGR